MRLKHDIIHSIEFLRQSLYVFDIDSKLFLCFPVHLAIVVFVSHGAGDEPILFPLICGYCLILHHQDIRPGLPKYFNRLCFLAFIDLLLKVLL